MANVTRNIGLSLGADICWPGCYEELVKRLNLSIPVGGDIVDFNVDRVTVEPYYLRQPVRYDVVLDRLTHWFQTSREWIKKAVIMDGLYVLNNPWSLQSMEKHHLLRDDEARDADPRDLDDPPEGAAHRQPRRPPDDGALRPQVGARGDR